MSEIQFRDLREMIVLPRPLFCAQALRIADGRRNPVAYNAALPETVHDHSGFAACRTLIYFPGAAIP